MRRINGLMLSKRLRIIRIPPITSSVSLWAIQQRGRYSSVSSQKPSNY
jgi:hypothetical protein